MIEEMAGNIDWSNCRVRRLGYVKIFGIKVIVRDWTWWGKLMIKLSRRVK